MKLKNFTQKLVCCLILAASVLTANAAEKLIIVGDGVWGGWSISNGVVMLNSSEQPDVFKATTCLNAGGGFKFLTETWFGGFEYRAGDSDVKLASGVAAALVTSDENGNDCKFSVAEKANYDIVCDLKNKTVTVEKSAYQDSEIKTSALWLIGGATPGGWSLGEGTLLTQDQQNPNEFKAVTTLNEGEIKIAVNKYGGFDQTFYQRDVNDDTKMVFGGDDNKWNITEAGTYEVKIDVAAMTISLTKYDPTAINSAAAVASATSACYTVSGAKTHGSAKGLTIVVDKNGKARKVLK